jgi:hypothetical protein
MEADHQGLPIAYNISLASLKSKNPGLFDAPLALAGTCADPQGEYSFGPGLTDLVSFFASKAL